MEREGEPLVNPREVSPPPLPGLDKPSVINHHLDPGPGREGTEPLSQLPPSPPEAAPTGSEGEMSQAEVTGRSEEARPALEEATILARELAVPDEEPGREKIVEGLAEILAAGNLSPQEIRQIVRGGFRFVHGPVSLPPEYQGQAVTEQHYITGTKVEDGMGCIVIYDSFGEREDSAHLLGHEIGHLATAGQVAGPDEEETAWEPLINSAWFAQKLTAWEAILDDRYIQAQAGKPHHKIEQFVDLVSDALCSPGLLTLDLNNPHERVAFGRALIERRLPRLARGEELRSLLEAGDPSVRSMIDQAGLFGAHLASELKRKKPFLSQGLHFGGDLVLGADSDGESRGLTTPSGLGRTQVIENLIDILFGQRPSPR